RYKPVIGDPHFMFYASCCMIAMASILCYVSYSPVWIIGHLGISELTFSGLFGLNAAINIVACFAAPVLVKRIGNRPGVVVALSLMLLAAVIEAAVYFAGPQAGLAAAIAFMAPMMILCVGFAILLGPATSMALSAFGERAGTATAMLGCIQMSGASILTALIQLTDIPAPYAIALVMGGFSSVLLIIMAMNRLSHLHQEQLQHD
ncbi:Bcr/CflA family drug resistance efflux transporter, partial [Shewanella sp. SG44-6]|nr:Bcr/CflA family drug resistance efflux transporter [Shewanella sp. SG44-6]